MTIEKDIEDIERMIVIMNKKLDRLIEHIIPKPKVEDKETGEKIEKSLERKGQTVDENNTFPK